MALTFRKLHPRFAAEVGAVDLRAVADRETLDEIRAGMDEFAVLVFRDLPFLEEVSIGHALVSRALFVGLSTVVHEYLQLLAVDLL